MPLEKDGNNLKAFLLALLSNKVCTLEEVPNACNLKVVGDILLPWLSASPQLGRVLHLTSALVRAHPAQVEDLELAIRSQLRDAVLHLTEVCWLTKGYACFKV